MMVFRVFRGLRVNRVLRVNKGHKEYRVK